jgi:D-alanyl-D-alanine carboxypeptidase (penicillin-binding protein 5/6)
VLLGSLLGVLLLSGPAAAASAGPAVEPVGGERMGAQGIVVDEDAPDLPADLTASSWLVADLVTGEVLAAKDPHGTYAPASTLKTLTAVALIPELDRDALVQASYDDIAVDGSKVGLVERLDYPVHELFTALMAVSGNDAANALASAAGGPERTAELMNSTARTLRALDTRAVNPHGLDAEGQVSSAYDLALIARAGMSDPQFAAYAATTRSSIAAPGGQRIEMASKNRLLKSYDGALGIKNGYTNAARASFVGAAERDGRRLVVTLMRAEPKVADEAAKLLDWGFLAAAGKAGPVGQLVEPVKGIDVLGSTNAPGTGPVPAAAQPADELASGSQTSAGSSVGSSVGGAGPELGRLPGCARRLRAGRRGRAVGPARARSRAGAAPRGPARGGCPPLRSRRPAARPAGCLPTAAGPQPRPLPRTWPSGSGPATDRPSRSGVA